MTVGEFKAWLEGFTENIKDAPSTKQWARIKQKLGEVTDSCGHWHWYPWTLSTPVWSNPIVPITTSGTIAISAINSAPTDPSTTLDTMVWNQAGSEAYWRLEAETQ